MLKKDFKEMYDSYQEEKKALQDMIEMNNIQKLNEENGIEDNFELFSKEEKEDIKKEIQDIDEDLNKKFKRKDGEEAKKSSIEEILDNLNEQKKNFSSDPKVKKILSKKITDIKDSLSLKNIMEYKPLRNKARLKKDFKALSKNVQDKLGQNNEYIFESCFQLNKNIKNLFAHEEYKEKSKIVCSVIFEYILINKLQDISTFVLFFLSNINNFDDLSEKSQKKLKASCNKLAKIVLGLDKK